jgi:hypothetical protein
LYVLALVDAWSALLLRLTNRKIIESQEINQPCFGETLTVFEFTSHIIYIKRLDKMIIYFPGLSEVWKLFIPGGGGGPGG